MAVDAEPGTTPQQRYTCHFTKVVERTPAEVRRLIRVLLGAPGFAPMVEEALLVTTELLTNVWKHTDGRCRLTLLVNPRGVHIHLRDYSRELPVRITAEDDQENGRGVVAVGRCATSFQVTELPDGKIVTATLALGPVSAQAPEVRTDDDRPRGAGEGAR